MHWPWQRKEPWRLPRVLLMVQADDGSEARRAVEDLASLLVRHAGVRLHVLVVGPRSTDPADARDEAMFQGVARDPEAVARGIRDRLERAGVAHEMHLRPGPASQALLAAERELVPDVIVLGPDEHDHLELPGYHGGLLDQVKDAVASSVLVARAGRPDGVAAALDGSEPSRYAAFVASLWARRLGLPFRLLLSAGVGPPKDLAAASVEGVTGDAGTFLVRWAAAHPRTLLVLGARGAGDARPQQMGHVSGHVSQVAASSVLVVRPARSELSRRSVGHR